MIPSSPSARDSHCDSPSERASALAPSHARLFAVEASVVIVVGLATWAMLRKGDQQTARAVVDLRARSLFVLPVSLTLRRY